MSFPFQIQPNYGDSPNAGNATLAWIMAANRANTPYLALPGKDSPDVVQFFNLPQCAGTWVNLPETEPVPALWTKVYPTQGKPQQFVPTDPADPKAAVYKYASLYGIAGNDLWVLGTEAQAALTAAQNTVVPLPPEFGGTPPSPPVPVHIHVFVHTVPPETAPAGAIVRPAAPAAVAPTPDTAWHITSAPQPVAVTVHQEAPPAAAVYAPHVATPAPVAFARATAPVPAAHHNALLAALERFWADTFGRL